MKTKTKRGTVPTELTPIFDMLDSKKNTLTVAERKRLLDKYKSVRYALGVNTATKNGFPQLHSILIQAIDDILNLLNNKHYVEINLNIDAASNAVEELEKELQVFDTMAKYRNEIAR